MPGHLYIAPAASGKTTYVLNMAKQYASRFELARVLVGSGQQVRAGNRRLALMGKGVMGVRVYTMLGLARELLDRAGYARVLITDPIEVRFLRSLVDQEGLTYYHSLQTMPGFIRTLRELFAELTLAYISPAAFSQQITAMGAPPRLAELASLYQSYRSQLDKRQWTDAPGLLTHALQALKNDPKLAKNWPFLAVDGFFRFHPAELALLRALGERVDTLVVTLTGDDQGHWSQDVAQRFDETIHQTSTILGVEPQSLADITQASALAPSVPRPLVSLSQRLFLTVREPVPGSEDAVSLIEAPDMAGEVRAALRWLKMQLVAQNLDLSQVALLARDISPYRDAIYQTAREFGLPVQVSGGISLRQNPAVDALIGILNLAAGDEQFPFRASVNAWRSPYFRWHWPENKFDITNEDADQLEAVARWGRVLFGEAQWDDAFRQLAKAELHEDDNAMLAELVSAESSLPAETPTGEAAQQLWEKWRRFVAAVQPPEGQHSVATFVRWLEDLIGEDVEEEEQTIEDVVADESFSLHMMAQIRSAADQRLVDRDVAAMSALKDVLRSLIWAGESLMSQPLTFEDFLTDFLGALDAARYEPLSHAGRQGLLAASIEAAAGVRFHAVALLGLAEGVFPAVLREDTFLRGADRTSLRSAGMKVAPSPDNREAALFYIAVTRADKRLLVVRPRLADGGAEWQPSPYWQVLRDLTAVGPESLTHESMLSKFPAASLPELMLALARYPHHSRARAMREASGDRWQQLLHGGRVARTRYDDQFDAYNGDLSTESALLGRRFGPEHVWSAGRLETYRHCPYRFFVSSILNLEERSEPVLGLDNRQLGLIYHQALEQVFASGAGQGDDGEALAAIWRSFADDFLDTAPEHYHFRPTAWWPQTRQRIKETMDRTLHALAAINAGWRPRDFEASFGMSSAKGEAASVIDPESGKTLYLRGVIDRVDVDGQGRTRIIDYKRGSVKRYDERSLREGRSLQLPLYALAVGESLGYGRPVEGFYWSIEKAERSSLRLSKFETVSTAIELAATHAHEAAAEVRAGQFKPGVSRGETCPSFCPAAAFCWRYNG